MLEPDLPDGAVVLNTLCIVEYMNSDGDICKEDFSRGGDDDELEIGKTLELLEWARAFTTSIMYAEMVHDYVYGEDE